MTVTPVSGHRPLPRQSRQAWLRTAVLGDRHTAAEQQAAGTKPRHWPLSYRGAPSSAGHPAPARQKQPPCSGDIYNQPPNCSHQHYWRRQTAHSRPSPSHSCRLSVPMKKPATTNCNRGLVERPVLQKARFPGHVKLRSLTRAPPSISLISLTLKGIS